MSAALRLPCPPARHEPARDKPPICRAALDADTLAALVGRMLSDAAPSVAVLRARLGWVPYRFEAALASAESSGRLHRWDELEVVVLAPLEAERLGLSLEPDDSNATVPRLRWVRADAPVEPAKRSRHPNTVALESELTAGDVPPDVFDRLPDPSGPMAGECSDRAGDALDALEAYQAGRIGLDAMCAVVGRAVAYVGLGTSWPGKDAEPPCPVCRGTAELRGLACCSWCCRSGIDRLIGHVAPLARDRSKREYVRDRTPDEIRERRRETRKERRRRLAAQAG